MTVWIDSNLPNFGFDVKPNLTSAYKWEQLFHPDMNDVWPDLTLGSELTEQWTANMFTARLSTSISPNENYLFGSGMSIIL